MYSDRVAIHDDRLTQIATEIFGDGVMSAFFAVDKHMFNTNPSIISQLTSISEKQKHIVCNELCHVIVTYNNGKSIVVSPYEIGEL